MSPELIFAIGMVLLVLFGWYFATDNPARKRWLGLVLAVLVIAFCLEQTIPPREKIRLGLDLKGGTSFLLQLGQPKEGKITKDMQGQAVEVIRQRVDKLGGSEPVISPRCQVSMSPNSNATPATPATMSVGMEAARR